MTKPTTRRVQVFTRYERLWHWVQAASILLLLWTGVEIHWPDGLHVFGFARATQLHTTLALLTIANAFLSLFYHLSTGAIRQFIPKPSDFFTLAIAQAQYYMRDIFHGGHHPLVHGSHSKLNVLQQVTYLLVLNLVLPVQVVTGIILWRAQHWQHLVVNLGGLRHVAGVHIACAWFFAAFLVGHLYMITTGRTPLAALRSMVVGWEEAPVDTDGKSQIE